MKIIKIAATRCHILKLKCTKFDFGWGSPPQIPLGELTLLPQRGSSVSSAPAGFKGLLLWGGEGSGGKDKGGQGKGAGREGREREKRERMDRGKGGGEGEWGSPPTIFALKVALFCCLSYSL